MKDALGLTPQDYEAAMAGFRARFKDILEDESLTKGERVARIVERMADLEEEPEMKFCVHTVETGQDMEFDTEPERAAYVRQAQSRGFTVTLSQDEE